MIARSVRMVGVVAIILFFIFYYFGFNVSQKAHGKELDTKEKIKNFILAVIVVLPILLFIYF